VSGQASIPAPLEPVRWDQDAVRLIDQRLLPEKLEHWYCRSVDEVARAIRTLAVRGAPAIGITAAYGVALGAHRAVERGRNIRDDALGAIEQLRGTRPTAVNLFHALDRMRAVIEAIPAAKDRELPQRLLEEAHRILAEDLETGRRIAQVGLEVMPKRDPLRVLTHCNAGGLATGGWGTALAPLYAAAQAGRELSVLADETRPLLQGRRLTAWELARARIPVRVLVDGAAASVIARGDVDLVIVGADRIAANGDAANKIGTFPVALAAREAGIPFYVAAPLSTFDPDTPTGREIPVEERGAEEVLGSASPEGVGALNPAFDVTPASLITSWLTERGALQPPFTRETLARLAKENDKAG
jgi:methylthioribose-1-phosphate isomerase